MTREEYAAEFLRHHVRNLEWWREAARQPSSLKMLEYRLQMYQAGLVSVLKDLGLAEREEWELPR